MWRGGAASFLTRRACRSFGSVNVLEQVRGEPPSPAERYARLVERGLLVADPLQRAAVAPLERLSRHVQAHPAAFVPDPPSPALRAVSGQNIRSSSPAGAGAAGSRASFSAALQAVQDSFRGFWAAAAASSNAVVPRPPPGAASLASAAASLAASPSSSATTASSAGVYLYGSVGCGKTMLMDLFYEATPTPGKRRVHFHAFMIDLHAQIHRWRLVHGAVLPR